jgi:rhodanese-related sulfurtransferase
MFGSRRPVLGALILALAATGLHPATVAGGGPGGNVYQATLEESGEKTPEISTEQLRRILADGSAVVVDARKQSEFAAGHIPGARNVDALSSDSASAVERLVAGKKNKAVVLYCNGPFCRASKFLGEHLAAAGFTNVRRYQLGMPVWRALGGPTEIELEGILRIVNLDRTAVFIDARSPEDFAKGSLPGARNIPAEEFASGGLTNPPLPQDDFNTRIILFGRDAKQARALADAMSRRPWHNVSYFPGTYAALRKAVK